MTLFRNNKTTTFRGVMWDDGWEFVAPLVVYSPVKLYEVGTNTGGIERMVEDYCIDFVCDRNPLGEFSDLELKEFKSRGWNADGFSRKRKGHHVKVEVKWFYDSDGQKAFEIVNVSEQYGKQP